jgi:hypothetical protein
VLGEVRVLLTLLMLTVLVPVPPAHPEGRIDALLQKWSPQEYTSRSEDHFRQRATLSFQVAAVTLGQLTSTHGS